MFCFVFYLANSVPSGTTHAIPPTIPGGDECVICRQTLSNRTRGFFLYKKNKDVKKTCQTHVSMTFRPSPPKLISSSTKTENTDPGISMPSRVMETFTNMVSEDRRQKKEKQYP